MEWIAAVFDTYVQQAEGQQSHFLVAVVDEADDGEGGLARGRAFLELIKSAISRLRARFGSKFSGLQAAWMKRSSCDVAWYPSAQRSRGPPSLASMDADGRCDYYKRKRGDS